MMIPAMMTRLSRTYMKTSLGPSIVYIHYYIETEIGDYLLLSVVWLLSSVVCILTTES